MQEAPLLIYFKTFSPRPLLCWSEILCFNNGEQNNICILYHNIYNYSNSMRNKNKLSVKDDVGLWWVFVIVGDAWPSVATFVGSTQVSNLRLGISILLNNLHNPIKYPSYFIWSNHNSSPFSGWIKGNSTLILRDKAYFPGSDKNKQVHGWCLF